MSERLPALVASGATEGGQTSGGKATRQMMP